MDISNGYLKWTSKIVDSIEGGGGLTRLLRFACSDIAAFRYSHCEE